MSLASSPKKQFFVVLPCDQELPPGKQPRWWFHFMSCSLWSTFAKFGDKESREALANMDLLLATKKICDTVGEHLQKWENVMDPSDSTGKKPFGFDRSRLAEVVTFDEAWELYYLARDNSRLLVSEKNVSTSQLLKPSDLSVPSVAEGETVQVAPLQQTR